MKRKRSATVEPVWGTLINFLGLRRMTSRGLKCANQALLMAAACYNLKKYMKHTTGKVKTIVTALAKVEGQCYTYFLGLQCCRQSLLASK